MKKSLVWSLVMLFVLTLSVSAHAALETIGTAQFGGSGTEYKLIYDADAPFGPITWLDYTNAATNWGAQNEWAMGLDSALTINLNSGVSVDWGDSSWRLPSTVDGQYAYGKDGLTTAGYNITSSEMGHLYYTELGNKGYYATDGTYPQPGWGLKITGDFENLITSSYWSGTEYAIDPNRAWGFDVDDGSQGTPFKSANDYGLAVRSGQVSVVPVPGALFLLGSGLVGMAGFSRRRKGSHC